MKKKTILIIDGQGGRLGVLLTERIKTALTDFSITAVGTNSIATAAMLRAGADHGATGEYPVICAAPQALYIVCLLYTSWCRRAPTTAILPW